MPPNTSAVDLFATFTSIKWQSPDGLCRVAAVKGLDKQAVTIKGAPDSGPPLVTGITYRFVGKWEDHPKHGRQFVYDAYFAVAPQDERGVLAYLCAIADGVGPVRAQRLWDRYGPLAVQTLRTNPEEVAAAGILSPAEAKEASDSLHLEGAFESTKVAILGMLAGHGFQSSRIIKELLKLYGHSAAERLRRNPYLLLIRKLPSCGWKRVDKLYLDLGHRPDRLKRQALVVAAELRNNRDGDTWVLASRLEAALKAAVPGRVDAYRAFKLGIRGGLLARRRDGNNALWLAEADKASNEAAVEFHLKRLIAWIPERSAKGVERRRNSGRLASTIAAGESV
jgi:hypothetical protein